MDIVKPKKLQPGDTIGIVAPGGHVKKENIERAAAALGHLGFDIFVHPQVYERSDVAAGSIRQRRDAVHDMFCDQKIDAIFAATGGLRSMQLLDQLDYDLIRRNAKIFCGFSDVTFLLSAFYHRAGMAAFHGLNLRGFLPDCPLDDQNKTLSFFKGDTTGSLLADGPVDVMAPGEASGVLFGGNLCLLTSLMAMGERYLPCLDNTILMIEDVGEEMRQIDRMLSTLRLAGIFDRIKGLIVGHMTDIRDNGSSYRFNRDVRDLVFDHMKDLAIPVIYGAPFGHDHPNYPFPIGVKARLNAPSSGPAQLHLLESPFADG